MRCARIWRNARLATMDPASSGLGEILDGLIACDHGRILYAGPVDEAPQFEADDITDCAGRWITPGLIDPHTHLVWGGDRANEFEQILAGASYETIARAGGGILSTVAATRASSATDLLAATLPLAVAAGRLGVTTLPARRLPARAGAHDLCLRFARPALDPVWVLDWVDIRAARQ